MPKALFTERYVQFRQELLAQRARAGLTQAQLSKKLNKPQSFVAKYENGERRLDVIEFIDVAAALGFDPSRSIRRLAKPSKS
jgi:transcriptional regulator with XRE-family HTH domain